MMKPKAQTEHEEGMLEYLEDIIGSNRFKDPIELLTQRIEKIQEIRSEKVSSERFYDFFKSPLGKCVGSNSTKFHVETALLSVTHSH